MPLGVSYPAAKGISKTALVAPVKALYTQSKFDLCLVHWWCRLPHRAICTAGEVAGRLPALPCVLRTGAQVFPHFAALRAHQLAVEVVVLTCSQALLEELSFCQSLRLGCLWGSADIHFLASFKLCAISARRSMAA